MSTASLAIDRWERERTLRDQRALRRGFAVSLAVHALLALVLIGLPGPAPLPLPEVVTVDLVAAAPRAAPAPQRPAPRPAAAKPPPPKPPAPKAAAVPPPQKKKVLPREAPKPRAKPKPKPRARPKPPPLDYDDALSALRDELGEPAAAETVVDAEPTRQASAGRVDPVLVAWQVAVNRAIARSWVTPMSYRDSPLRTLLMVTVMADGRVLGEPEVRRSSGDPQFDDNAIRAVMGASPLPPPPSSGDWPFLFNPSE